MGGGLRLTQARLVVAVARRQVHMYEEVHGGVAADFTLLLGFPLSLHSQSTVRLCVSVFVVCACVCLRAAEPV